MDTIKITVEQFSKSPKEMVRYQITKVTVTEVGTLEIPKAFVLIPSKDGKHIEIGFKPYAKPVYYNIENVQNNLSVVLSNYTERIPEEDNEIILKTPIEFDIIPSKDPDNNTWKFWAREEESVWAQDPYQFNVCTQMFKDNK